VMKAFSRSRVIPGCPRALTRGPPKSEFTPDSVLEGTGFELPVRARSNWLSPLLCCRILGTGRCALSVFGQHDALHQIGVDPTAEAAIRAGVDILAAGDRGVTQSGVGDL
jgi:hypothetical protein